MGGSWFAHGADEVRELSFLFCGRQNCQPGEAVGPAVREHYVMHYCLSGRGVYRAQGVKYEIGPGDGFLILPGELSSYQADAQQPWNHVWVGFSGSRAADYLKCCGLGKDRRTFRCANSQQLEDCVQAMLGFDTAGAGNDCCCWESCMCFWGGLPSRHKLPSGAAGRPHRSMWSWPWSISATTSRRTSRWPSWPSTWGLTAAI